MTKALRWKRSYSSHARENTAHAQAVLAATIPNVAWTCAAAAVVKLSQGAMMTALRSIPSRPVRRPTQRLHGCKGLPNLLAFHAALFCVYHWSGTTRHARR